MNRENRSNAISFTEEKKNKNKRKENSTGNFYFPIKQREYLQHLGTLLSKHCHSTWNTWMSRYISHLDKPLLEEKKRFSALHSINERHWVCSECVRVMIVCMAKEWLVMVLSAKHTHIFSPDIASFPVIEFEPERQIDIEFVEDVLCGTDETWTKHFCYSFNIRPPPQLNIPKLNYPFIFFFLLNQSKQQKKKPNKQIDQLDKT